MGIIKDRIEDAFQEFKDYGDIKVFANNMLDIGDKSINSGSHRMIANDAIGEADIEDYIDIRWNVEDVMNEAGEMKVKITEEQAKEVLSLVQSKHDCNMGVTWETIRCAIDETV